MFPFEKNLRETFFGFWNLTQWIKKMGKIGRIDAKPGRVKNWIHNDVLVKCGKEFLFILLPISIPAPVFLGADRHVLITLAKAKGSPVSIHFNCSSQISLIKFIDLEVPSKNLQLQRRKFLGRRYTLPYQVFHLH